MKHLIILLLLCTCGKAMSQGYYFGPKVGLVVATQKWNYNDRSPLLALHGDVFVESLDPEGKGSFYAQVGIHTRGSATRVLNLSNISQRTDFRFNNASLGLGVKKRLDISKVPKLYYMMGLRAEYTISTNLSEYDAFNNSLFYPLDFFVNKFMYGVTVGGGIEYVINKNIQPYLEFSIMPDLSSQYNQPYEIQATNPFTNQPQIIRPREIRNLSLEITLGLKFLREVIYLP